MPYTPKEIVDELKKIDLLTYFKNYEPEELVRVGANTYTTKTHDSLRISNGLWHWFSRKVGGKSAIDYLKIEKNMKFKEAIDYLADKTKIAPVIFENITEKVKEDFKLPEKNYNNNRAKFYLMKRGVDRSIIEECLKNNIIYEEKNHHNVVFVGYDKTNKARYAFERGTNETRFMKDTKGSDKTYTFRLLANSKSNRVHFFESAIDLLSYATLMKLKNLDFHKENLISLAGVSVSNEDEKDIKMPLAIKKFLNENEQIKEIYLHLDNDEVGRGASKNLQSILSKKYKVFDNPAPIGKDCNDYLCCVLGYKNFNKSVKEIKEKVR